MHDTAKRTILRGDYIIPVHAGSTLYCSIHIYLPQMLYVFLALKMPRDLKASLVDMIIAVQCTS